MHVEDIKVRRAPCAALPEVAKTAAGTGKRTDETRGIVPEPMMNRLLDRSRQIPQSWKAERCGFPEAFVRERDR